MCKYLEDLGIHYIDYSGKITMEEGLARIEKYAKYFEFHSSKDDSFLLLFDASNTTWDSPETHLRLSKIGRERFDIEPFNKNRFTAILNSQYNFLVTEKEHWFTNKENAINWLLRQSA